MGAMAGGAHAMPGHPTAPRSPWPPRRRWARRRARCDCDTALSFAPFRTFSSWAWNPSLSWSPDGELLSTVIHVGSTVAETGEESPVFDLAIISPAGTVSGTLATGGYVGYTAVLARWGPPAIRTSHRPLSKRHQHLRTRGYRPRRVEQSDHRYATAARRPRPARMGMEPRWEPDCVHRVR